MVWTDGQDGQTGKGGTRQERKQVEIENILWRNAMESLKLHNYLFLIIFDIQQCRIISFHLTKHIGTISYTKYRVETRVS